MKKYYTTLCLVLSFIWAASAQVPSTQSSGLHGMRLSQEGGGLKASSHTTLVTDVLHYYLNKHYFKTGNSNLSSYPLQKTNATDLSPDTAITIYGSRFQVPPGDTLVVTGLEGYARRMLAAVVYEAKIHLYLFYVNPANGFPVLPAIDSITTSAGYQSALTPSIVGGDFTNAGTMAARTMTADFAVGFRNMDNVHGNFIYLLRTAALTSTNPAASDTLKYGEGGSFVRYQGQFYNTRDFNMTSGFGPGTDYEFMLAPRVQYKLRAGQRMPDFALPATDTLNVPDTVCTRTEMTFTNTSSGFFTHRHYNLNQFYRKWNLTTAFPSSVSSVFSSDSSVSWNFEFYDQTRPDSRVFLPYTGNTISAVTDLPSYPDCFTNQFKTRFKPMAAFGTGTALEYDETFSLCFKYCNDDALGVSSVEHYPSLQIYPNPALHCNIRISGLTGKNTIKVRNTLGHLLLSLDTQGESTELDLNAHPPGTYLLQIENSKNQSRMFKCVLMN